MTGDNKNYLHAGTLVFGAIRCIDTAGYFRLVPF